MPVKKIPDCTPAIQEVTTLISNQLANSSHGKSSPLNCMTIIVVLIFIGMVSFEVATSMEEKFTVTDNEAKSCLMDFQSKNCNALDLDGECQKLFSCIQREEGKDQEGVGTKIKYLFSVSLKELK